MREYSELGLENEVAQYAPIIELNYEADDRTVKGQSFKYESSLIRTYQREAKTPDEREQAQELAMQDLRDRINAGLLEPRVISDEILQTLGATLEIAGELNSEEEILTALNNELESYEDTGSMNDYELGLIKTELADFVNLYQIAFPDSSPEKTYALARDNMRKIVYQNMVDKKVFQGTDHGAKHILKGNLGFAKQILTSLEQDHNFTVAAINKVLIHQTIIDHDLGYTYARIKDEFNLEATNDHPLFATAFIESNKDYYTDKFSETGYEIIRTSVLNHSYPRAAYENTDFEKINYNLIRSITSTVDALGVTAETKVPEFFNNPGAIKILLKIKMSMEKRVLDNDGNEEIGDDGYLNKYKEALLDIARQEPNINRQEGFINALNGFFNKFLVNKTLKGYTALVHGVSLTSKEGRLVPKIEMQISKIDALMGSLFGGDTELGAFKQIMEDFGFQDSHIQEVGLRLDSIRRQKQTSEPMEYESDRAVFTMNEKLHDEDTDFDDVKLIVRELFEVTILPEINSFCEAISDSTTSDIESLKNDFIGSISTKIEADELSAIQTILSRLESTTNKTEIVKDLKGFITRKEQAYLES